MLTHSHTLARTRFKADATDRLFLIFLIPPALGIIMAVFGLVASAYAPAMIAGVRLGAVALPWWFLCV